MKAGAWGYTPAVLGFGAGYTYRFGIAGHGWVLGHQEDGDDACACAATNIGRVNVGRGRIARHVINFEAVNVPAPLTEPGAGKPTLPYHLEHAEVYHVLGCLSRFTAAIAAAGLAYPKTWQHEEAWQSDASWPEVGGQHALCSTSGGHRNKREFCKGRRMCTSVSCSYVPASVTLPNAVLAAAHVTAISHRGGRAVVGAA